MPETTGAASTTGTADVSPRTDRLELLQQLSGSIGVVYKARNPKLDRIVALRQIQVPEWLDDVNDILKRMLAEARAANVLDHPNIARLYTGGFKGFTVFLTSEFVEGPTLREFAKRNPSLPEIMPLARQLCLALDYAHEKKVFHYALNPANLKVLPDGKLKILDFGLLREKQLYSPIPAKRLENEHYVSPEQLKQKPVDRAANLFSVATILYELFTTRNPFAGKHLGEVDRNISDVEVHAASLAHQRVPEAVSKVLLKALSKSPVMRYQSGQELIAALEEAMSAAPVKAASAATSTGTVPQFKAAASTNGSGPPATKPKAAATTTATLAAKPATTTINPIATASRIKATPAPPAKLPAKALAQWKLAAAIVAVLFMVSAAAISLRHRSDSSSSPADNSAQSQTSPLIPGATPQNSSAIQVREIQRRAGHEKVAKLESAPAPASVTNGQLSISSVPDGATIEIAGRAESWKTPQTLASLAPGVYKVTLSKAGYATETRNVGTPAGARIVIDGRETGKSTPAEFALDPAVHSVTLRKEGYLDSASDIKLAAGQSVSYAPSLKLAGRTDNIQVMGGGFKKLFGGSSGKGMARIEIKSDPKGAQVVINGTTLTKTTPVEIQLEPGNYEVTLQKDGYQPVHTSVLAQANDKLKVDEALKK